MIILETEHLLFRPLELSDLDNLMELYADPEVMRFPGGSRSRDEVQHALKGYMREYDMRDVDQRGQHFRLYATQRTDE